MEKDESDVVENEYLIDVIANKTLQKIVALQMSPR
jgi:hypothetical protein